MWENSKCSDFKPTTNYCWTLHSAAPLSQIAGVFFLYKFTDKDALILDYIFHYSAGGPWWTLWKCAAPSAGNQLVSVIAYSANTNEQQNNKTTINLFMCGRLPSNLGCKVQRILGSCTPQVEATAPRSHRGWSIRWSSVRARRPHLSPADLSPSYGCINSASEKFREWRNTLLEFI